MAAEAAEARAPSREEEVAAVAGEGDGYEDEEDALSLYEGEERWSGRVFGGPPVVPDVAITLAAVRAMKDAERRHVVYRPNRGKALKYRSWLVNEMMNVAAHMQLSLVTQAMAIQHLDRILSSAVVGKSNQQLLALVCTLIAAKFEERDNMVPRIRDLIHAFGDVNKHEEVTLMEGIALQQLGWRVDVVTPVHFLRHFARAGLVDVRTDLVASRPADAARAAYVEQYAVYFLKLCLNDYAFQEYPPSVLASGIVLAARNASLLDDLWPPFLADLTGYAADDINVCSEHILRFHDQMHSASSPARVGGFQSEEATGAAEAAAAAATAVAGASAAAAIEAAAASVDESKHARDAAADALVPSAKRARSAQQ